MIHPTAVISPKAIIGADVTIGPYCVINDNVTLGDRCHLHSHVVIDGHATIGSDNEFYPFAAIGQRSQDLKYAGEPTSVLIGDRNTFRENVTVHRGTTAEPSVIGHDNHFLAYAHVAHDSIVGNHCILSNGAAARNLLLEGGPWSSRGAGPEGGEMGVAGEKGRMRWFGVAVSGVLA